MYNFTDFLEGCMKDASVLAMTYFGSVSGTVKPDDNNQVLTEADIAVGKLLVKKCKMAYPEFNIIDEEAGVIDNGSQFTVVIDPIDGTSNFANGLPLFGIFIGILDGAIPVAGAIALPAFGETYIAERGKGSFCNGKAVQVSTTVNLKDALIAYGIDGHQENPQITHHEVDVLSDIILGIRNLRTSNSAFDIAAVADGRYGAILNQTSKIWDNVATHIVIEEAGGICTDFFGEPMDFSDPLNRTDDNFSICAGAPVIHTALQRIIHAR